MSKSYSSKVTNPKKGKTMFLNFKASVLSILICLVILVCQSNRVDASQDIDQENRKIYLAPQDICINEEGIFIALQGDLVNVTTLFSDESGIYVLDSSAPHIRNWRTWKCRHCGWVNSFLDNRCQNPDCPTRKKK